MKLLDSKEVQIEKSQREESQRARTEKMQKEESDSVLRLNAAREGGKLETARVKEVLEKKRAEANAEMTRLDRSIASRRAELRELLKPIDAQKRDVALKIKAVEEYREDLDKKSVELENAKEQLTEMIENVHDREQSVTEKEQELGNREGMLNAATSEHKIICDDMAKKQAEFHTEVLDSNTSLARREQTVEATHRANENVRAELEKERKRLKNKELELQDRFHTLEQSINKYHKNVIK